jgi:ABC-2 type transport system permease protein
VRESAPSGLRPQGASPAGSPWPALIFLWRRSFINVLKEAKARAKQPRYAVGLFAGAAYFAWLGWILLSPEDGGADPTLPGDMARTVAPLLLAVFAVGWWVSGRTHMALAFSPPEVQFLFQGPLTRRTLLNFRLVRAQLSMFPMCLIFGLAFGSIFFLPIFLIFLGIWLLFSTAHLHQVASGLIRSSWSDQGGAGLRRQWLPMVVLAGAGGGVLWAFWPLIRGVRTLESASELLWQLQSAMAHPAAQAVFFPFHLAVGPLLAPDVGSWLIAMAGGLALLGAHYFWVVRTDQAFEEVAAGAGLELQAITAAFREGRLSAFQAASNKKKLPRPWFRLAPEGHPAVGLFWKNFTAFTRSFGITQVLSISAAFLGFWVIMLNLAESTREASLGAMGLPGMLAAFSLIMGPLFIRNDLRTDLQRSETLRTLPLSGRDVVAAEVGASAASLTMMAGFFLVVAFVFFLLAEVPVPHWWWPWAAFGLVLFVLPFLCALATGIQNIIAVAFPAWVRMGPTQAHGVDQTGNMMVGMLLTGLLLAVGLLCPLIFGAATAFRFFSIMGVWAVVPGLVGVWVILAGEVLLLVVLLGEAFDEMDPSAEGLLK